jgi:ABC-type nitrate/sulfonate/bicarbonate transport system permease component
MSGAPASRTPAARTPASRAPAARTNERPRAAGWAAAGWMVARWIGIVALLVAWEGLARSGVVTAFQLPPLSVVLKTIADNALSGDLFVQLGLTLYRTLAGFAIAGGLGVVLGILIARSAAIRWFFDPIISVGFPMPKIAFLPIVVLWLGYHDISKISMVVFDATFPVLTATIAATRSVELQLIWSARSLGASRRQVLREILVPAAMPEILTGLQVALPIALIVCIIAEMLTGGEGLGGSMITASRFANSPGVFAGIVEIAVAGYILIKGLGLLRRRLLRWHPEVQTPTTF